MMFLPETILVEMNIVYDANQMSEDSARSALKDNIAELERAYLQLNVKFRITFTAGASNEDRTLITQGAIEGAINIFLYDNTRGATENGSYYISESRQIFLTKVAGGRFREGGGILHELGHLFRDLIKRDPRTGIPVPIKTAAGWIWGDAANYTEDYIINTTNEYLLSGKVDYRSDFVPGTVYVFQWALAKIGDMAPKRELKPNSMQILRMGAMTVASQMAKK
jgi:hypothetical protein